MSLTIAGVLYNVVGVGIVGRQGRLNKLWIPNDDKFVFVNHQGGWWRSGKMLGVS